MPSAHYSDPLARDVYSVSRLNCEVRALLEEGFPPLWVEGEISNLARPASGHLYFSLKDAQCQVRCAMFRMQNRQLGFTAANGSQILARVRVSLYPGRGEFQLVVDYMEEAGAGALRRAFEQLKQRLAADGLFDLAVKRALPAMPRRIGVITSPTGAAIRDILSVVCRRWRGADLLIYPVPVQGREAAPAICQALALASERAECDVLILARGGGSLEDLQAFNEESVARAIRTCNVPVVTGVGHETDFTIADLAADQRAPTPSAAAELVTPDVAAMEHRVLATVAHLHGVMARRLRQEHQQLAWLQRRLRHPRHRLADASQHLDGLSIRAARATASICAGRKARLATLQALLQGHHPGRALHTRTAQFQALASRLQHGARRKLAEERARVDALMRALGALGPGATLARGYAIVTRVPGDVIVRNARSLSPGDAVCTRFADGRVVSRVQDIDTGET